MDIGIGFHSQKNIAQYPIHPNTSQYWPIPGMPILVSFKAYKLTVVIVEDSICFYLLTLFVTWLTQTVLTSAPRHN